MIGHSRKSKFTIVTIFAVTMIFIFNGCTQTEVGNQSIQKVSRESETISSQENKTSTTRGERKENIDILQQYKGEWIIDKIIAAPRVGIVAYDYSMDNTPFIGEKVYITENELVFLGNRYLAEENVVFYDPEFLLSIYIGGDIVEICGTTPEYEKDYHLNNLKSVIGINFKEAESKGGAPFGLRVRDNGGIMLEILSEELEYMGYYELRRQG